MNLKELKELIALMNEHDLSELELEREGMKVRLKKSGPGVVEERVVVERGPMHVPFPAGATPSVPEPVPKPTGLEVKSPMVGTFYRAPAPEASAFVEVGQEIEPGQVLCIIEAMKLMNEIKAEVRGRLLQILVENGQPVEFGQVLFLLEPL